MKSIVYLALAVFAFAFIAEQASAGSRSFFSLNVGNGRSNFRQRDAFRQGFRAGQRQQFRQQQFRGHGNQFRSNFRLNLNDHCN